MSEVNILRELRNPFIVRYYDRIVHQKSAKLFIVMEYCEGGDLSHVIKRHRRDRTYIAEEQIWKYAGKRREEERREEKHLPNLLVLYAVYSVLRCGCA